VEVSSATLAGTRVHVRPPAGETLVARDIVPVKPLRPVMVIVEVPVAPARIISFVRLAATVKSWTM